MIETSSICERTAGALLAVALRDTVAELRLIDAADLVAYIKSAKWANIADLLQSSSELSFRDGALTFACAGEVELAWNDPPSVVLELEFQHHGVNVFFRLVLGPSESRVVVDGILYAARPRDEEDALNSLALALAAARCDGELRA